VYSYKVTDDGSLLFLSCQNVKGAAGCHVVAEDGHIFVSNYHDGKISVLPIGEDGMIGELVQLIEHKGQLGPNTSRQERPHCHELVFDEPRNYAFVADLGLDRVVIYKHSPTSDSILTPYSEFALPPGSGPRHMIFHPTMNYLYILNELTSSVTCCEYDSSSAKLTAKQHVSTLPLGTTVSNTCAAIRFSKDGKHLYASNRGHDSVSKFNVLDDGTLELKTFHASGGLIPRDFNFDNSGKYVFIGNQNSDNFIVCSVDADGNFKNEYEVHCPFPVNFHFVDL